MKTITKHLLISVLSIIIVYSCAKNDITNQSIIPFTVSVSSSVTTKVTLDSDNRTCYFDDTDILHISGTNISGTLYYVDGWYTDATFSGDLVYTGEGTPASDLVLTATLNTIPDSYASAISTSLSDAMDGYSYYSGTSTYANKSFVLNQNTAFVDFSVHFSDGSTPDGVYAISISDQNSEISSGNITVEDGMANFIVAFPGEITLDKARATINGKMVKFGASSQTLSSGHVYSVEKDFVVTPSYVDLGLSVKWATFNLGATSIYEIGNYYAWGELIPKPKYSWNNYKFTNSSVKLTKYCTQSKDGVNYMTDGKTSLDNCDDAAAMALGGSWRMPTRGEFDELWNNCDWVWIANYNGSGINGILGTSKKPEYTSVTIFLPAGGIHGDNITPYGINESGFYWSSSLYSPEPLLAYDLYFDSYLDSDSGTDYAGRSDGKNIRPVLP